MCCSRVAQVVSGSVSALATNDCLTHAQPTLRHAVVRRFLFEGTKELHFSGPIGALNACPLTQLRRIVLNVTSSSRALLSGRPYTTYKHECSELSLRTATPSLLDGHSVTDVLSVCPAVRWLEIDWSSCNIREQLTHAAKHVPQFKEIPVVIAGRFVLWEHAPEFYCFRGFSVQRRRDVMLAMSCVLLLSSVFGS